MVEITKPMAVDFPVRHACGGALTRILTAPAVHYAAAGFYATDVDRLKKQVGSERFAQFEKQKAAAERRAKSGKQTPYERSLERAHV